MIERPRELASWKEIAVYLGVSERAAQLWERQRGLPVHRLPGPGRGRVLAYPEELDAWKRSASDTAAADERPRAAGRILVPVGATLFVLLAGVGLFHRRAHPVSVRMEKETLLALGESGEVQWSRVFPGHQMSRYPDTVLADLDGDGSPEVLLAHRMANRNQLVCMDSRGRELWRYKPGRAIQSQNRSYENSFGIQAFVAAPMGRERKPRIAVSANHGMFSPAQVTLLDGAGRVLREYWHPGHLNEAVVADLDGDGSAELYLAGTNNPKGSATIVVLDPDRFDGSAVDDDGRPYFPALAKAEEAGRVLMPRTEFNRRCWPYNAPVSMSIHEGEIQVGINENPGLPPGTALPTIIYSLSPNLRIQRATLSDGFVSAHAHPCGGVAPSEARLPSEESLTQVTVLSSRTRQSSRLQK